MRKTDPHEPRRTPRQRHRVRQRHGQPGRHDRHHRGALLALSRAAAFTLVEMLVALAVVAILASAALPDFRATIERHAVRAAAGDLMAALHLARSQAIGRGEIVVVAPAEPGGAAWREGWIVFSDRDGDGRPGAGDEVLFSHGPVAVRMLVWSGLTLSAPPWYVAYNSAGRTCRADNALAANWGTLSLQLGGARRNIKINMLGRARLCDPDTESGCTAAAQ